MSLPALLGLSSFLFALGVYGLLTRRNVIAMFLAIELMLNAAIINFIAFTRYPSDLGGDEAAGVIFPLFIIALTSCEMAVGLALVVAMHRRRGNINVDGLKDLHG